MAGRQYVKLPCDILARTDLTMTAKIVYAVLWDAMRGSNHTRLSYSAIAKRAGAGRTAAARAVAQLDHKTDLEVGYGGQAKGQRNTYRLPESSADSGQPGRPESGQGVGRKRDTGRPESGQEVGRKAATCQRQTTTKTKAKKTQTPRFSWAEVQPMLKDTPLDTPEFAEAWTAWEAHRREIKYPLTSVAVSRQLKALVGHGLELAIRGLDVAMKRGWRWFEPEWLPSSSSQADDKDWAEIVRGM